MASAVPSGAVKWCRAGSVIARRVAGETVLVPLAARTSDPEYKAARLYVLNETGEYLWSLLDSPRSFADRVLPMPIIGDSNQVLVVEDDANALSGYLEFLGAAGA